MSFFSHFCHSYKYSHSGAVLSLLPVLNYPSWYNEIYHCALRIRIAILVPLYFFSSVKVLTYNIYATQISALSPIIEGLFICLSLAFLVNKFH